MQNSNVRFKLYKAKKNWISAGLVTTAVLAGLTLGSVKNNDVVAHADSNVQTAQTTAPKQQVTQGEYDAQKDKVDQANNDVQNQTTVVNNDKSALNQASGVNTAVNNVKNIKLGDLKKQVAQDKPYYDQWQKVDAAQYQKAQDNLESSTKDLNDAKAAQDTIKQQQETNKQNLVAAKKDVSDAQAQKTTDVANNAPQPKLDDDDAALNRANETLHQVRQAIVASNDDMKKAQQKQFFAQLAINQDNETIKNLAGHKEAADRYAKNAAELAQRQADRKNAQKLADDYGQIASDKYYALKQAQLDNLLPDADQLADMESKAQAAQDDLKRINSTPKMQNVQTLENNIKGDEHYLGRMQDALKDAQTNLDHANAQLAAAQKAGKTTDINFWQGKVNTYTQAVKDANDNVAKAQKGLDGWKDKLNQAKDSEYNTLAAEAAKDQDVIDQLAKAKKNLKDAQDLKDTIKPLQDKLAKDQETLNAMTDAYNREKGILDAMYVSPATPDTPDHGNTDNPSTPDHGNTNNPSTPDHGNTTTDGNGSAINDGNGSAAVNNGSAVNGATTAAATRLTRAEYRAQQNAAAKSNTLPQTGNSESAAAVALGAVSAMLGLGLASKKREF